MILRSASVNRTVVDLSFSFPITVSFTGSASRVSLPKSNEGIQGKVANRYRFYIETVSPREEFSTDLQCTQRIW